MPDDGRPVADMDCLEQSLVDLVGMGQGMKTPQIAAIPSPILSHRLPGCGQEKQR